ncbi:hypothetical protein GIB67_028670 [Kingdonia uniflora]|uniref:Aminotransferase class I/classII large domain-containing protein n=1 Tax=Kingdonia uniflora TaxID=39325 RepID=A0A7J7MTN4_9MAGN|nr:hypothetical protein GIB67_028670 [Kingdonia uniflora]
MFTAYYSKFQLFIKYSCNRAIAVYLSRDLPYKLSSDEVFLTLGCTQAIEVILSVLARPGANLLLPRPGYPYYEARAAFINLEVRHFDLLPSKGWEVDLDAVEALADDNTAAMVIINPGNPCGNVFTYEHLKKVAETARRLGIIVIADVVYDHLTFGRNPFVPMGVFGSIVPVLTLGSISKRWIVPVKLNPSLMEDIKDDMDFCVKLAKEESVIVLPGRSVGLNNWFRITFAIEASFLTEGLGRIKSFYRRHAKIQ